MFYCYLVESNKGFVVEGLVEGESVLQVVFVYF